jgi:hypothetical protein
VGEELGLGNFASEMLVNLLRAFSPPTSGQPIAIKNGQRLSLPKKMRNQEWIGARIK